MWLQCAHLAPLRKISQLEIPQVGEAVLLPVSPLVKRAAPPVQHQPRGAHPGGKLVARLEPLHPHGQGSPSHALGVFGVEHVDVVEALAFHLTEEESGRAHV